MAVPATLANVDLTTDVLEIGAMRRRHDLALDGSHCFGSGQRFFEIRNEPLARHRQRVETQRRDQNNGFDAIQEINSLCLKTTWVPANSLRGLWPAPESICHA